MHEGRKVYKCNLCSFCCEAAEKIKKHLITVHEKTDLSNCRPKQLLDMNLAVVIENSPEVCEQCKMKFDNKRELKMHISSLHEGKKLYGCALCQARFPDPQKMKTHIISVHQKHNLTNCLPQQLVKINIANEIGVAQTCEKCSETFSSTRDLRIHIASVHDGKKLFRCSFCKAGFVENRLTKMHMESVHTNET